MKRSATRSAPWALLAALLMPASAAAQPSPDDKAAAEVLFDEGRKLAAAGDYDGAAKKLEASQRLDAGVGTLLYLADAYEKAGRTASAWATFREAASVARAGGQLDRETVARDRTASLEPKLSYLTITLAAGADAPGLTVLKNKAEVKSAVLGTPLPADPGSYHVEVTAPGKKPWSADVKVGGAGDRQSLTIPPLESAPAPVAAPPAVAPGPADPARDAAPGRGDGQRLLGGIVAGAGVVSLGVSGFFLSRALSKDAQADDHCDGTRCSDMEGVTLSQDARSAADLCGVFVGAGAALVAGGAVLYFTAPSGPAAKTTTVGLTPVVGERSGGLLLGGRF